MQPTLNLDSNKTGVVDFGLIDDHDSALKKIKRFQIVTTYYPWGEDYVDGFD